MTHDWRLVLAVSWLVMGAASGCSSSNDSKSATAESACQDYCVAEKDCDANTTLDDCLMYACADLDKESSACQSALKAFYECAEKATDVCAPTSCDALASAYHDACS